MCIHNHQPIGNFDFVMEEAYEKSYHPFLASLERHPSIKLSFHTTGFLIDWLAEKKPGFISLLREMVSRGQIEMVGGGHYEPILSVIPYNDRVGQIKLLSDRIEELFGKRPRGMWLAERIWEPGLPSALKDAGMEYVVVDDYHFIKAGLGEKDLHGYYVTEDEGSVIKIFPGSERLRYLIPFRPLDELEGALKGLSPFLADGREAEPVAVYADDGEKFGVWPGTHKWVYDEGWLRNFLERLGSWCGKGGWLRSTTFSEYIDSAEPLGRVYLPTTSYMEMGEWTLPHEASVEFAKVLKTIHADNGKDKEAAGQRLKRFVQGGTWRGFFAKYPESNWMHKRVLGVSKLASRMKGEMDGAVFKRAESAIYRAECNDAFWHGVFGGLYMPHLRTEVYKNLLTAERALIDACARKGRPLPSIEAADVDADDRDELILRGRDFNLFLNPAQGGALYELDHLPSAVNLSNTLSRWKEAYHEKIPAARPVDNEAGVKSIHDAIVMKEEGLERHLKFDAIKRASFVERFIDPSVTLEKFAANDFKDLGHFQTARFASEIRGDAARLTGLGKVAGADVLIIKEFRVDGPDSFGVTYMVSSKQGKNLAGLVFGVEMNLIVPACAGLLSAYGFEPGYRLKPEDYSLASTDTLDAVESVSITDDYAGVAIEIRPSSKPRLWRFPLVTVSQSEAGFESIYQGSCLFFGHRLPAADELMFETSFTVRLSGARR